MYKNTRDRLGHKLREEQQTLLYYEHRAENAPTHRNIARVEEQKKIIEEVRRKLIIILSKEIGVIDVEVKNENGNG